jgi:hypothetical protein
MTHEEKVKELTRYFREWDNWDLSDEDKAVAILAKVDSMDITPSKSVSVTETEGNK